MTGCWYCETTGAGRQAVCRLMDTDGTAAVNAVTYTCTPCTLNILFGPLRLEQYWTIANVRRIG